MVPNGDTGNNKHYPGEQGQGNRTRERLKTNSTVQVISRTIGTYYEDRRGRRHHGYEYLKERGLLQHPEHVATITVGQITSGSKVASTAVRIGTAVASTQGLPLIWREKFDIGLWLLSVAVYSGLYEVRRNNGEQPTSDRSTEPYRIWSVYSPARQTEGYLSTEGPFPEWTDSIDEDGRQLLYSDCYTPEVRPDSTWINAVHHLEGIPFQINKPVLKAVQRVGVKTSNPTKREQLEQIIATAEGLLGSTFHHRVHIDQRGRIYISRSPINFQQGDIARGLLEFAEGVPLTDDGIRAIYLHIANCNGEKGDINERIEYAKDHHATWIEYAEGSSDEWQNAPDPWQLLRACIELATAKVGDRSHLIVPIDQTCSGLAWQSIVMSDPTLATLTNLRDGHHDLYSAIGDQLNLPADSAERRTIIKNSVMLRSYGAGARTIAMQLRDWALLNPAKAPYLNTLDLTFVKDKRGDNSPSLRLMGIAQTAIDLLASWAPATREFSKAVRRFYKSRLPSLPYVQWLSPSGFFCRVRKEKTDKVLGDMRVSSRRIQIVAYAPTGTLNYDKMLIGSLANVIHSLDASLVHIVLANSEHQIVPVHDSFGSHASNVFKTQRMLMDTLVLIESMNPSLCLSVHDHGDKVTWSELQAQDAMQNYLDGTNQSITPVVDPTATNVFS